MALQDARRPYTSQRPVSKASLVLALLALPATMAQSCISLRDSSLCPSFSNASISTGLTGDFSFLAFVSDVKSFDSRLQDYIDTAYVKTKYQDIIGCSSLNLKNTTDTYARYTTSFLCNAIVQASIDSCKLSDEQSRPLCADSCAEFALSEQRIASTPSLCGTPGKNANDQIRADLTRCQLPTRVLSAQCINAYENEPTECGFGSNLSGLCAFCASSSPNSTDSCCVNSNVNSRCQGVQLPTTSSMPPLFTTTTTTTATASAAPAAGGSGLSGGAIAGIVIGSLIGAALLLGVIIVGCILLKRRRNGRQASILNTPSPTRQAMAAQPMLYAGDAHSHSPPPVLPGARVARMSALEGSNSSDQSSHIGGGMAAFRRGRDTYDSPDTPRRMHHGGDYPKRGGSLSSHSALGFGVRSGQTTPRTGSDPDRSFSSPDGVGSGQSEQLQFFKDYYSQDDIHPNDVVSVLWAYQPRANDEFELERGDMLKVVGIWDDGWATGLKLSETAEEWESRRSLQRDSGVSNGSRHSKIESDSEIKAFPLVCVCLPQHWRKTIEGDSTDMVGGGEGPPPSP